MSRLTQCLPVSTIPWSVPLVRQSTVRLSGDNVEFVLPAESIETRTRDGTTQLRRWKKPGACAASGMPRQGCDFPRRPAGRISLLRCNRWRGWRSSARVFWRPSGRVATARRNPSARAPVSSKIKIKAASAYPPEVLNGQAEALADGGGDPPKTILMFDKCPCFNALHLARAVRLSQAEVGGHENENEASDHVTARGERSGCRAALLFWNWDWSGASLLCTRSGLRCALLGWWTRVASRILGCSEA